MVMGVGAALMEELALDQRIDGRRPGVEEGRDEVGEVGGEQAVVLAPAGQDLRPDVHLGCEVEHHRIVAPDGHRVPGPGTDLKELVLHAQTVQPIGEVADRLGIVEVGLPHPAFRLGATNAPHEATFSVALDRTAAVMQSTRGYRLRSNLAWASPVLGSDDRYLSLLGEAVGYVGLSPGWVLAGRLQAGSFLSGAEALRQGTVPPQRRFYGGGPNSVRGFPINGLGPQTYVMREEDYNRVVNDGDGSLADVPVRAFSLGGTQVALGTLELRGPSPVLARFARVAAFVDVGQVWSPGLDERSELGLAGGPLVVTPGIGLRIATPVGPIRADLGYNAYDLRSGPLYLATSDGSDRLSDLIFWRSRFQPEQQTLLDRIQLHIAVGQAF